MPGEDRLAACLRAGNVGQGFGPAHAKGTGKGFAAEEAVTVIGGKQGHVGRQPHVCQAPEGREGLPARTEGRLQPGGMAHGAGGAAVARGGQNDMPHPRQGKIPAPETGGKQYLVAGGSKVGGQCAEHARKGVVDE